MAFDISETSAQEGKPAFLVSFSRPGKGWFYTNVDQDIVFDAQVYTAVPLTISSIIQSGDAKSENMDITLPATATISRYLDLIMPTEAISVKIRKIHMVEDAIDGSFAAPGTSTITDAPVIWVGEYIGLSRPTLNSRKFSCNTLALSLSRGGLRLSWGRSCPHVLYGRGCLADKSKFSYPLTNVAVIDGITLGADQFGTENIGGSTDVGVHDSCGDLSLWTLSPNQTLQGSGGTFHSVVYVDGAYGNPAPCFSVETENNHGTPAYAIRDFGIDGVQDTTMSVDIRIIDAGSAGFGGTSVFFGIDGGGNGPRISVYGHWGSDLHIRISTGMNFLSGEGDTIVMDTTCTGAISSSTWYTVVATRSGLGSAVTITAVLKQGLTTLGTVTATQAFTTGGFCGPISAKGPKILHSAFDNFTTTGTKVQPMGLISGGFIEWYSEPGVMERTGVELELVGQAKVLGSTQGMASGSNFVGYLGCDRTAQMCHDVFDNLPNFGGINHMQGRSPFDGQPVFYGS